ncbi:MAG TPA: SCO family protein [Bryobacteraceae bacterium]|nr:SCO family protein [Bryobacteraceae bacterium]
MRSRATVPATILAGLGFLSLSGCAPKAEPLPVLGEIPEFTLTAQDGAEFHGGSLRGSVWVADFIFTTCAGPCPRMSWQMSRLQEAFSDKPDVKFVSFTVDPERDTPEVLAAYGKRYQAQAGRWYFLTGPEQALHKLNREAFKLGNVDGSLNHSTRFVLLDRQSRVRGYYDSSDADSMKQLLADLKNLVRERS